MNRPELELSLLSICACIGFAMTPAAAAAHGRAPDVSALYVDPSDALHIVGVASFGLVQTHDGGQSWTWTCADSIGFYDDSTDPPVAFLGDSNVVLGTYDGLTRSERGGCSWSQPYAELTDVFTIDVSRSSDGRVWTLSSPGTVPDTLWVTEDAGESFVRIAELPAGELNDRVRVAPSDPSRLYLTGVIPSTEDTPRRGLVHRSDDGGRTMMTFDFTLADSERSVRVLAVDPNEPDRVFARVVGRMLAPGPEESRERLVLSEDGGRTWRDALIVQNIGGFAIDERGDRVWAGDAAGGLFRSDDGGVTFVRLDAELRVRCLEYIDGDLWACGAARDERSWDIGRSSDLGATFEAMLELEDLTNESGCGAESPVGDRCPMFWPDLQFDLGLTTTAPSDAGAMPTPGASGCSCSVAITRTSPDGAAIATLAAIAALLVRWRDRRATG